MTWKSRSVDHEATWLNLVGYALRPGFGADLDPFRIDELWRLQSLGISFPKEMRVRNQWWILWRRVAGGLDRERQERLLAPVLPQLQNRSADGAELFRFVGSLERISLERKEEIVKLLVRMIVEKRSEEHTSELQSRGQLVC